MSGGPRVRRPGSEETPSARAEITCIFLTGVVRIIDNFKGYVVVVE
jgi:hypothetical protein